MSSSAYAGKELELFSKCRRWKDYWISKVARIVQGDVLEVGAGIGANTLILAAGGVTRWLCLEPDAQLAEVLRRNISGSPVVRHAEVRAGTIRELSEGETFDTILYIDVLEHVPDDRAELDQASRRLNAGGRLVVLSPAHAWLYSPFDASIGHYRRYTASGLRRLTPPGLSVSETFYLDSVGLLASAANRLLLRQPLPGTRQLAIWDAYMIPWSRALDPLLRYRVGRTVVCIWNRGEAPNSVE